MKDNTPQDILDQYGFTLIELMISLVLGLLISAAIMQVFLTSQRVDRIQTAGSEIQDKAVFGLQSIEPQIRLANLGNDGVPINDITVLGGIVLTAGEYDGGSGEDLEAAAEAAAAEAAAAEAAAAEAAAAEAAAAEKAAAEKAAAEKAAAEKAAAEKAAAEKAAAEKAAAEKAAAEKAAAEKAAAEQDAKDKAEQDAKKLEKEADALEKEADALEKEAENMGIFEKIADFLSGNAERRKKETAAKRTKASAKRVEAARLRNQSAYNFRNFQSPDFQRADFQVSDFQRADFQRADFQRADFQRADFQRADFQRASFQRASFQRASFQRASFQRASFQRASFQKVAATSSSGLFNVMVKGGLKSGYLTRSHEMSSTGGSAKWGGLSNTGQPSDQLTIQYINTTGRTLYDCEGSEVFENEHVITRYFITESTVETGKTRKNLNLNCDAGRITSDGVLEDFRDSGETIIQNIDQFNIRLGVQRSVVDDGALTYQYADMTVADYMDLDGEKPAITNIRIAILARSTANSPEASADEFMIFGTEQTLKPQDDAPKYLRRVYESNILLRNARVMRITNTSVT